MTITEWNPKRGINPLTTLIDDTGTVKYIGEASAGSNTSPGMADARWRIQRVTSATGIVEWAGTGDFDQVWNNRASLTYA